ncbi:MAG: tryptophan 7-halogenase, partial [Rhodobacteraceae bacterium]|nr:tryptophan 7-halogenase [Paracoccaceae bacterium]
PLCLPPPCIGRGQLPLGVRDRILVLPVNRAMSFWLPHDPDGDIPPYTLARAMGSGWMWQIPTQTRMGCGYVYSDLFLTPEEAQSEVKDALGRSI